MSVKEDCEVIMDRASRILALIRVRHLTRIELQENADLGVDVTPAMKQTWKDKIDALQAEIKTIVAGW